MNMAPANPFDLRQPSGPKGGLNLSQPAPRPLGYVSPQASNQAAPPPGIAGGLWKALQPYLAGQAANTQQQVGALFGQIGVNDVDLAQQKGFVNTDTALAKQLIGLSGQDIGVDQGANARQDPLLNAQQALANQGFDLNTLMAWQAAQRGQQDLSSDATARGAMSTGGTKQGFGRIVEDLRNRGKDIDIQRQGSNLTFAESHAQVADAKKHLDIAAQKNGISAKQLDNQTAKALSDLGLSTKIKNDELWAEIGKIQNGQNSAMLPIIAAIQQATGLDLIGSQ